MVFFLSTTLLKIRTEYSLGQTFAPIDRIIKRLKELNVTAAGIVDDATWGHVAWYNACKDAGIQPLLGVECVVTKNEYSPKMWFLARNKEGLSELYEYISQSYHQKFKLPWGFTNRLYPEDVLSMSDNIIKFAGEVISGAYLKECGAYVDFAPYSVVVNSRKANIVKEFGLKKVGVCDNAYVYEDDKPIFEAASKMGLKMTPQHIFINSMGVENEVAKLCLDLELPKAEMPSYNGDLYKQCFERLPELSENGERLPKEYKERLDYEIKIIREKGFESYFLIVADMVKFAKSNMLVGPSRGSAAGSLVCYLCGITEIDPIKYGLMFERFIDLNRFDYPDIDLDFPDNKRHLVFDYMSKKYGKNATAHIGTILRYGSKSSLDKICRQLDIPKDAIKSLKYNLASNLKETFETVKEGQDFIRAYPRGARAAELENHAYTSGTHAAGLLICKGDIDRYATVDDKGIAHVEKGSAEQLGILKIDVLGLTTLSILEDAGVKSSNEWYQLEPNDPSVLASFSNKTAGIFQYDGYAVRGVARNIDFKSINDVAAITAIARPGPMSADVHTKYVDRSKGKDYTPLADSVEEILKETYGLPIYQEQTIRIVREVGGLTWDEATKIRKSVSKTGGNQVFVDLWPKFLDGAKQNGLTENQARRVWDYLEGMGAWQMNASHAYSYATVSYWTAWLKHYHPLEFACACLKNLKNEEKARELLKEMVREGLEYVPFDVQNSQLDWSIVDGKLLGGFKALKGISDATGKKLIAKRDSGGLTEEDIKKIESKPNVFEDLFPIERQYAHLYDDHEAHGIATKVSKIADFDDVPGHCEERVFIATLIHKQERDENEPVNLQKRGGQRKTGNTRYVDLRFEDDTGRISGRISSRDFFSSQGQDFVLNVPIGSIIMVRAAFYNNFRYVFVKKWKRV